MWPLVEPSGAPASTTPPVLLDVDEDEEDVLDEDEDEDVLDEDEELLDEAPPPLPLEVGDSPPPLPLDEDDPPPAPVEEVVDDDVVEDDVAVDEPPAPVTPRA